MFTMWCQPGLCRHESAPDKMPTQNMRRLDEKARVPKRIIERIGLLPYKVLLPDLRGNGPSCPATKLISCYHK